MSARFLILLAFVLLVGCEDREERAVRATAQIVDPFERADQATREFGRFVLFLDQQRLPHQPAEVRQQYADELYEAFLLLREHHDQILYFAETVESARSEPMLAATRPLTKRSMNGPVKLKRVLRNPDPVTAWQTFLDELAVWVPQCLDAIAQADAIRRR